MSPSPASCLLNTDVLLRHKFKSTEIRRSHIPDLPPMETCKFGAQSLGQDEEVAADPGALEGYALTVSDIFPSL